MKVAFRVIFHDILNTIKCSKSVDSSSTWLVFRSLLAHFMLLLACYWFENHFVLFVSWDAWSFRPEVCRWLISLFWWVLPENKDKKYNNTVINFSDTLYMWKLDIYRENYYSKYNDLKSKSTYRFLSRYHIHNTNAHMQKKNPTISWSNVC